MKKSHTMQQVYDEIINIQRFCFFFLLNLIVKMFVKNEIIISKNYFIFNIRY